MTPAIPVAAGSLLAGIVLSITPTFRQGTVLFGVHVTPDWLASAAAKRTILVYRAQIFAWTVAAVMFGMAGIGLLMAGALAAFVIGHNAAVRHRPASPAPRSASLAPVREGIPGGIPALLLPFLLLAGAAVWLNLHWDQIPARFPVHWDLHGHVNRWGTRGRGVYAPLMVGGSVLTLMVLIAVGLLWGSPRGNENTARFRQMNLRIIVGTMWVIALVFSYTALMPVLPFKIPLWLLPAGVICAVAGLIWPLLRMNAESCDTGDTSPDEAWRYGMIYYNPQDSALMVQRRYGTGYTLNFGNRLSWVVMAIVVAMPLACIALLK